MHRQQQVLLAVRQRLLQLDMLPKLPALWGQFNDERFTGFPSKDDPYAALSPHWYPQALLVPPHRL